MKLRRFGAAIVCLSVVIAGVAFLSARGSRGTVVRRHTSAACGPSLTSFDAPDHGTSALQGTGGISINDNGDIAGIYVTSPNLAHGYVRAGSTGTITEFDTPDAGQSKNQGTFPVSVNAGGDIAGMYFDGNNAYHGFVRTGSSGTITEFDATGAPTDVGHRGTSPLSINAAGEITGLYSDTSAVRHGFIRAADGTFTTVDVPEAGTSSNLGTIPISINASGSIVGFYVDTNQLSHAFLRTADGTITAPIDAPDASTTGKSGHGFSFSGTIADGIDTAGDITGIYSDTNGIYHGYVRSASGTFTEFDVTGAGTAGTFPGTLPLSINSTGDVAGFYSDVSGVNHGFWRAAATGTITAPIDAPNAVTSGMFNGTVPFSINGSDNLAGTYPDVSGVLHAFVMAGSQAATPTFSPAAGTYTSAQTVTLSDTTTGVTIYYTTNGKTPTSSDTKYTGPITVTSTETIKAIAIANGCSSSTIGSAAYTINASPDFQLSVKPTSLTIVAGQSGTATFTVTPLNGFNSQVSFACSGLPAEAACSFNPATVTPSGSAVSSTLTVTTTANSASTAPSRFVFYATLFPMLAMFGLGCGRRTPHLRLLTLLIFIALALTACGGSSSQKQITGTPPGTSTISVSASTSASGGVNHAATLTITVTQ
ncbi:MAG TPA: chitobiase/beta-hexosaminidase C-terminal domain-containing protein [Candidatus Sulfotelmatobacter sp.]|nr:chitobiase/beta-hexosaminidase C-terminal domain-containing protein [Candidatus Sulfotelmatobacter sp.]